MKFYYVYVLRSINKSFLYVGYTSDLKRRFEEHNKGGELSTKAYAPFDLIHYEAYRNEQDTKRRERYFKTTKGKTTLRTMLQRYFNAHPLDAVVSKLSKTIIHPRPHTALDCPVCGGAGEAPTKSTFTTVGRRTGAMVGFCMTCEGRGWVENK